MSGEKSRGSGKRKGGTPAQVLGRVEQNVTCRGKGWEAGEDFGGSLPGGGERGGEKKSPAGHVLRPRRASSTQRPRGEIGPRTRYASLTGGGGKETDAKYQKKSNNNNGVSSNISIFVGGENPSSARNVHPTVIDA